MDPVRAKEKGKTTNDLGERSCELEMRANGNSWSDLTHMARDRDGLKMFECLFVVYTLRGERQW